MPVNVSVLLAVSVLLFAIVRVAVVAGDVRLTLLMLVAVATPRTGVTNVGLVSTTNLLPVPVCDAIEVALPTDVIGPVRFAFVVTLPAVKPAAVPVMFVPTRAVGVPNAGVTNVGEVARTGAPVPVAVVHTGRAAAPPPTRISVVAPLASVC